MVLEVDGEVVTSVPLEDAMLLLLLVVVVEDDDLHAASPRTRISDAKRIRTGFLRI